MIKQDTEMTNMMLKMFRNGLTDMSSFHTDDRFGFPGSQNNVQSSILYSYQHGQTGRYTIGSPSVGLEPLSSSNNMYSLYDEETPETRSAFSNPLLSTSNRFINEMEDEMQEMENQFSAIINAQKSF